MCSDELATPTAATEEAAGLLVESNHETRVVQEARADTVQGLCTPSVHVCRVDVQFGCKACHHTCHSDCLSKLCEFLACEILGLPGGCELVAAKTGHRFDEIFWQEVCYILLCRDVCVTVGRFHRDIKNHKGFKTGSQPSCFIIVILQENGSKIVL